MSDFAEQSPEGGVNQTPQLAQAVHEGGVLSRNIGAAEETSANSAVIPEGVESALRIDAPVAPCANAVGLRDGERVALASFNFISPFQSPAIPDKVPDASKENVHRPNPPRPCSVPCPLVIRLLRLLPRVSPIQFLFPKCQHQI